MNYSLENELELVDELLHSALFMNWLRRWKPDTTVGVRCSNGQCPIATYVREQLGGSPFDITIGTYKYWVGDEANLRNLPDWACRFVEAIDMGPDPDEQPEARRAVTAEEALNVLWEVVR